MAACYAFGLARSHRFNNGNKRTAWMGARIFLIDNGHELRFDPADAFAMMISLADGTMMETDVAIWFRSRATKRI